MTEDATRPGELPHASQVSTTAARHADGAIFWLLSSAFAAWIIISYHDSWYFWMDDWTLLGTRLRVLEDDGYIAFLLRPHNEHLMAGMVLWDVGLAKLFGLRSYLPWVVTVALANIGVAWVCRAYMLRLGVTRSLAAASAPFVLIWMPFARATYWAPESIFAITAALAMGQFLLTEHDDQVNRRDAAGAMLGLGAVLIHSSAALFGPIIVAILLWRRRFRAASIAAIPALVGALWLVTFGRQPKVWNFDAHIERNSNPTRAAQSIQQTNHDPLVILRFARSMMSSATTGRPSLLGGIVVLCLVAYGVAIVVRRGNGRLAVLSVASSLVFFCAIAWNRAWQMEVLRIDVPDGRYMVMVFLPLLPVAVLACQDLLQRALPDSPIARLSVGTAVLVLVFGLQIRSRVAHDPQFEAYATASRTTVADLADDDNLSQRDGKQLVFDSTFMDLTVEDVRRFVRMGWLGESE